MEISICQDKTSWDKGILQNPNSSFLQSWDWGEFQRAAGREPVRLQIVEGEGVVGQIQGFIHHLGFGLRYLYAPRFQISDFRFQIFVDYCQDQGFVFLRFEPYHQNAICNLQSEICNIENRQPRHSLVLDCTASEAELLAGMHAKTRYNIGIADRKGVIVHEGAEADIFWKLNEETRARDRFRSHGREYYEKMLASPLAHQLTAYIGETSIAANVLVHFGDTLTYLHGASSNEHRNLMAPYLLQWEGIKLAKRLGCRWYDLWGVAPSSQKSKVISHKSIETCFHNYCWEAAHPWTGITRFKVGFGGEPREYGEAVDVVLRPNMYKAYQVAKRLRGILTMLKHARFVPHPSPSP